MARIIVAGKGYGSVEILTLLQRNAELEGRNEAENADLRQQLEAAQERVRRLKAGLQKYGLHLWSDCLDKRRSCVCGLGALLADSKKEAGHDN